ncbi:MAG: hypothetical protein HFF43_06130 [Lawsonibacter sp.]|jgi:hypothetical protein|nr:hypothetical protein [Lawsonibacter sp.]
MRAAVLLLWAGCLYAITRSVCCLLWMASPRRQLLTLAVLALAALSAHKPEENTSRRERQGN